MVEQEPNDASAAGMNLLLENERLLEALAMAEPDDNLWSATVTEPKNEAELTIDLDYWTSMMADVM